MLGKAADLPEGVLVTVKVETNQSVHDHAVAIVRDTLPQKMIRVQRPYRPKRFDGIGAHAGVRRLKLPFDQLRVRTNLADHFGGS